MARVEITDSEIIAALKDARRVRAPDPPGAFVISEMAKKTRQSQRTIRGQLDALRAKGLVEHLKVYREGSDGRHMMVSAYRILRAPKAKR